MPKNELKKLYDKILKNNIQIESNSEKYNFSKIIQNFKTIEDQDRPDGFVLIDDTVFVLEHFQISIYTNKKHQDLYQKAMGSKEKFFLKNPNETEKTEELKPQVENLLESFKYGLKNHLSSYATYISEAQKKYPNKKCVFILVIEDNSQDILIEEINEHKILSILHIKEFVEEILYYPQIDGVISYNTCPIGDFLVAEDSEYLYRQKINGNLVSSDTYLLSCLLNIIISNPNLLPKDKKECLKCEIERLIHPKERAVFKDEVHVEKNL